MKTLTAKEKKVIDLVIAGTPKIEAIQQVYNCKNYKSAGVISTKVFNREKVKKRLDIVEHAQLKRIGEKSKKRLEEILDAPRKTKEVSDHVLGQMIKYTADKTIFSQQQRLNETMNLGGKFVKQECLIRLTKEMPINTDTEQGTETTE